MPTETLNIPLSNLDEFDFSRNPSDMDFESESPNDLPTMFYPDRSSGQAQFVSPNTLMAQNSTSTPIKRIYPGMHSQQAAQAKAQQAQKQEQLARQQQQRMQGQKPLPTPSTTKAQPAKDPLVEESISKVLNRMRQASVVSATGDDGTPLTGMSNMPRIKKDEDDMDEDERLLASEEGKKLSSKERRQLRNKVSARAFRSRRKGKYLFSFGKKMYTNLSYQNISVNSREKLRPKSRRPTTSVLKISNFERRTTVLPTSLACCSLPRLFLVFCKSLANLGSLRPTRMCKVSLNCRSLTRILNR